MPDLLLTDAALDEMSQIIRDWPTHGQYRHAAQVWLPRLVREIRLLRKALRVLHAASKGPHISEVWKAWASETLKPIREAIEEESDA